MERKPLALPKALFWDAESIKPLAIGRDRRNRARRLFFIPRLFASSRLFGFSRLFVFSRLLADGQKAALPQKVSVAIEKERVLSSSERKFNPRLSSKIRLVELKLERR